MQVMQGEVSQQHHVLSVTVTYPPGHAPATTRLEYQGPDEEEENSHKSNNVSVTTSTVLLNR